MLSEDLGMFLSGCLVEMRFTDLVAHDRHTLIPPLGYKIAGISGSCAAWVDGFSLIIQH